MMIRLLRLIKDSGFVAPLLLLAGLVILFPYAKSAFHSYAYISPIDRDISASRATAAAVFDNVSKDSILVPRIGVNSSIVRDIGDKDLEQSAETLAFGVARYTFSSLPGGGGNSVFTGHNVVSHGNEIFARLHLAEEGDIVLLNYRGKKLAYEVTSTRIVSPERAYDFIGDSKREQLTLITCFPPPIDVKRLIVIARPTTL